MAEPATVSRTTKFKDVVEGILRKDGLEITQLNNSRDIVSFINQRIRQAWSHDWWPESMQVEQKHYHHQTSTGRTYDVGDILWDPTGKKYYEAIVSTSSQDLTDASKFSAVSSTTEWTRYIPYWQLGAGADAPGSKVIYRTRGVYMRNPLKQARPGELSYEPTRDGIVVSNLAGDQVWVEYQQEPPEFTLTEYASSSTYTTSVAYGNTSKKADLVYDPSTGECYKALNTNTSSHALSDHTRWERIYFPSFLDRYVRHSVYSDMLAQDGQTSKAIAEDQRAEGILADLGDVYIPQKFSTESVQYTRTR